MRIRKATKKDLKEIAEIFRIESAKKPYLQKWNKTTAFEKIEGAFKKDDIYVAVIDGEIAGFMISRIKISAEKKRKEGYIDEFWLKAAYQGKGIGTSLLGFVENKFRRKGLKIVSLIANQRARAVDFYKKLKYKTKQELLYMEKELKR